VATFVLGAGTLATNTLVHVGNYQKRLFFVKNGDLSFYYNTSTGALTGTVAEYPTRQLFPRGGYLVALGTWSADGGDGLNDRLCAITSEGEIAVFQGTDPASDATWGLVGVYYIGRPIGRRCFTKIGAELLILTERGLLPITKALTAGATEESIAVTFKIDSAFNDQAKSYFSTFGWDVTLIPRSTVGIVNIPSAGQKVQYVWNLLTKAWSRFTGWEASCTCLYNGELYLGMQGKVAKALTGASDFGSAINATMFTAFNYFGSKSSKRVVLLRPTFASDGPFGYFLGGNTNFAREVPTGLVSTPSVAAALWDTALWDAAFWSADYLVTQQWETIDAPEGYCFSTFLKVTTATVTPELLSIDYKVQPGTAL
jgi:hypothetical protein